MDRYLYRICLQFSYQNLKTFKSFRYIYGEKMNFDLSELFETYLAGNKHLVYDLCEIIESHLCDNLNDGNKALIYDQLVQIKLENRFVIANNSGNIVKDV